MASHEVRIASLNNRSISSTGTIKCLKRRLGLSFPRAINRLTLDSLMPSVLAVSFNE